MVVRARLKSLFYNFQVALRFKFLYSVRQREHFSSLSRNDNQRFVVYRLAITDQLLSNTLPKHVVSQLALLCKKSSRVTVVDYHFLLAPPFCVFFQNAQ